MTMHICKSVAEMNLSKAFEFAINKSEGAWFLHQRSLAIELDVKGGEADLPGEEMSRSSLVITFCPYCGVLLD